MASIKNIFTFALLKKVVASYQKASYAQIRTVTFYPLSQNIQYISKDPNMNIKIDRKTMKLSTPIEKPVCYMLSWMNAKNQHIAKYANLYLDRGFDVFNVTSDAIRVMFPKTGTQPVAKNVLKFMEQNGEFNPIVLQGFSVGGYMWGEVCKYASEDLTRYQPLMDRIKCQIWDCAGDLATFKMGLAVALFPKNIIAQKLLNGYIQCHFWVFRNTVIKHFAVASKHFHGNLVGAPALILCSKTDTLGPVSSNLEFKTSFEKLGIKVTMKIFENSPHIRNLQTYPEEYQEILNEHLMANVPMLSHLKKSIH